MTRQPWDWCSRLLSLGLATTVVSADIGVPNARLKGLNRPSARNVKNVVYWDMLLKIARKIPRTRERGARIGYPGRKGRTGRHTDPTWKSSYKWRKKLVGAGVPMVGSP